MSHQRSASTKLLYSSRRLGQLFLDRPVSSRRNTISAAYNHTDTTALVDPPVHIADTNSESDPDEHEHDDEDTYSHGELSPTTERRVKMDKLKRTLGDNVPAELVFGTHLTLSMYRETTPPPLKTPSPPPVTINVPTTSRSPTPAAAPRTHTPHPWIAPWEEIDPETYARAHNTRSPSPSSFVALTPISTRDALKRGVSPSATTGLSFWKKAGATAAAATAAATAVGKDDSGRRGSEGGSSGSGRRGSDDSITRPTHGHGLSVVRIGTPESSAAAQGHIRREMSVKLSLVARGAASGANRAHGTTAVAAPTSPATATPRVNLRRATRIAQIFGTPGLSTDEKSAGEEKRRRCMGKLDAREMAGLAYMLDYERDTLFNLLSRAGDSDADPEWPYEHESRRIPRDKGKQREQSPQGKQSQLTPVATARQRAKQQSTHTSASPAALTPHPIPATSLPPAHTHPEAYQHRQRAPSPNPHAIKSLPLPPPHDPDLHPAKRPHPPTIKRTYSRHHDDAFPGMRTHEPPKPEFPKKPAHDKPSPKNPPTDLATLQRRRATRLEDFFHVSYRDIFECMVAFPGVDDDSEEDEDKAKAEARGEVVGEKRIWGERGRGDRLLLSKSRAKDGTGVSMMAVAEMVTGAPRHPDTVLLRPPRLDPMTRENGTTAERPKTSNGSGKSEVSAATRHRRSASLSFLNPTGGLKGVSPVDDVATTPTLALAKIQSATASYLLSSAPPPVVSSPSTPSSSASMPPPSSPPASSQERKQQHLKPHPNPLLLSAGKAHAAGRDTPVPPSPPPFTAYWQPTTQGSGSVPAPAPAAPVRVPAPVEVLPALMQTPLEQEAHMMTTTAVHVQRKGVIKRVVSVSRGTRGGVGGDGGRSGGQHGEDMQGVMNRLRELR